MTLEYLPLSHSGRATGKYRREHTVRRRHKDAQYLVHLVTVENLMRSSGGVQGTQQDQSTHTQDARQDLCLEDETSKSTWVGNYRIPFLEENIL